MDSQKIIELEAKGFRAVEALVSFHVHIVDPKDFIKEVEEVVEQIQKEKSKLQEAEIIIRKIKERE